MKRLLLTGIVRPERAILSIPNVENELKGPDGRKYRVKFNAYSNQITALIESEDDEDNYTLRNIVRSVVELVTDVVGFLRGYAYDVEIIKIFSDDLELSQVFGIEIPALEERNKKNEPDAVGRVYPLCLGSDGAYLRRALGDLGMAIKHAEDTPFYCFRAIESLKQYFGFVTGKVDDREQWKEMGKAIGDYRSAIEPIRSLAFPARHGVPEYLTDEMRRSIFATTWQIVETFINYRLEQLGSSYRLPLV